MQRPGNFFRQHESRQSAPGGRSLPRHASDVLMGAPSTRSEPIRKRQQRLFRPVPSVRLVIEVAVGVDLVVPRTEDPDRWEPRDGVLPAELDLGGAVYLGEADAAVTGSRAVGQAGLLWVFLVDSLGDLLLFFFFFKLRA